MKTKDFLFNLPEELIAQHPCENRDHSRMMVVNRHDKTIACTFFYTLPDFLNPGDIIVLNDSRVIPARLTGRKITGSRIEILLLEEHSHCRWEVLLRPAKRVKTGTEITFQDGSRATVRERMSDKKWIIELDLNADLDTFLERHGSAPLPPYIKRQKDSRQSDDIIRYQTIYARNPGSIAAPTAGLHFSDTVFTALSKRAIDHTSVTLHVGYGTFLPIETEFIPDHRMEKERYEISPESAVKINAAQRVVAVGTTSTRTMESAADSNGIIKAGTGNTDLFIYPGYRFKRVDALLTNFHLPQSSLFLLVCAFAGKELMEAAYRKAIDEKFRFYSYGDCMLII